MEGESSGGEPLLESVPESSEYSSWKYLLFFEVDLTGLPVVVVVTSDFCLFDPVLEAVGSLSDARLFCTGAGAAADTGTARDDRRGMARERFSVISPFVRGNVNWSCSS